jgi:superfamily II DNA/RNA helicase
MMSPEILEWINTLVNNPIHLHLENDNQRVRQYFLMTENQDKLRSLLDILNKFILTQLIIFCQTEQIVNMIATRMERDNYSVSSLGNSKINEIECQKILREFCSGDTRVLITTDFFSRRIHAQQVSLVINYDLPINIVNYIHRINRVVRYGRIGTSINLITQGDLAYHHEIEEYYHHQIEELPTNVADL